MHLFCFGTLMDADIRRIVIGRPMPDHETADAVLAEFRRVCVPDEAYPAAVPAEGSAIRGLLVGPITPVECERVRFFEGFEFRLTEITVLAGGTERRALVCLATQRLAPDRQAWDFEHWRSVHKPDYVEAAATYMAGFEHLDVEDAHSVWLESRGRLRPHADTNR